MSETQKNNESTVLFTQPVFILSQDFDIKQLTDKALAKIVNSSGRNARDLISE